MSQHKFSRDIDSGIIHILTECQSYIFNRTDMISRMSIDLPDFQEEIFSIKKITYDVINDLNFTESNYLNISNSICSLDFTYSEKLALQQTDISNIIKVVCSMSEIMTTHEYKGSAMPCFVLPEKCTPIAMYSNNLVDIIRSFLTSFSKDSPKQTSSSKIPSLHTTSFVEDKLRDYIQIINSDTDSWSKVMASVKWLSGISGIKSNIEKVFDIKFNLPDGSPLKDGIDFIKAIDMYTKFADGSYKYFSGQYDGDIETMIKGGTELKKAFKSLIGLKTKGIFSESEAEFYTILVDYAINLTDNIEEAIYQFSIGNYSQTQVYEQIFGETLIESTMDTLKPFTTLAADAVYKPISNISNLFGINLNEEYAKFSTSNTGSGRLSDGIDEIEKIIKESGGYWENWKSGMKLIFDKF